MTINVGVPLFDLMLNMLASTLKQLIFVMKRLKRSLNYYNKYEQLSKKMYFLVIRHYILSFSCIHAGFPTEKKHLVVLSKILT